MTISNEAIDILKAHHWPGNVREIQHTIERGVIMANEHQISLSDFNLSKVNVQESSNSVNRFDNLNLHEIEKMLVQKAIDKYKGNISKAAKDLGLTRAALYRRLEKFNL